MKIREILSESKELYFHGTGSQFTQFRHQGSIGFYFTTDYEKAKSFTYSKSPGDSHHPRVIAATLDIKNPATPEAIQYAQDNAYGGNPRKVIREILQKMGFDSIVHPGEVVVFEPSQIHIVDHNY